MRIINKSMLDTRQVQAPTTENFIKEFKVWFDEQSKKIITFSAAWCSYRNKRLTFDGLNKQDLFDAKLAKILSSIPRVSNNRRDKMIGKLDWQDHNANLKATLQRIEDNWQMHLHSHIFTGEDLRSSPDTIHKQYKDADHRWPERTHIVPTNATLPVMLHLQRFKPVWLTPSDN